MASTSVVKGIELSQELLRSANIPVTKGGDTTELVAELDNSKACFAELQSVKTISVRRHKK